MRSRFFFAALLGVLSLSPPADADQLPFVPGSLAEIERAHEGQAFILVLWEIGCAPCHAEMVMLGKLIDEQPDIRLVLVSTDPIALATDAQSLIRKYGLAGIESWSFADENIERLRYGVDPDWFGELPRNYFYDAKGNRSGRSGTLEETRVREWFSR
jgi:hypothetical protein